MNGLRWAVRTDMQWRVMPSDLPLCSTVCQQTQH
jgi:hypothetical protein